MASTVTVVLEATVTGLPYTTDGSLGFKARFSASNTSGLPFWRLRTAATAMASAAPSPAKTTADYPLGIIPQTTWQRTYRITASTAEIGIQVGPHLGVLIPTTFFAVYTTEGIGFDYLEIS